MRAAAGLGYSPPASFSAPPCICPPCRRPSLQLTSHGARQHSPWPASMMAPLSLPLRSRQHAPHLAELLVGSPLRHVVRLAGWDGVDGMGWMEDEMA